MTYETQVKIKNWGQKNQNLIENSRILISGSGLFTHLILLNLTGLGVGNITIVDNENDFTNKEFLYKLSNSKFSKNVKNLVSIVGEINNRMNIKAYYSNLNYTILDKDYDVIIDASNDPNSKAFCLEFALRNEIPFISAAASKYKAELRTLNKKNFDYYHNDKSSLDDFLFIQSENKEQGPIPCGVVSAEIANVYRQFLFKLSQDEEISDYFVYNLKNKRRFFAENDYDIKDYDCLENVIPVLVGAGALGNPISLGFNLMGVKNMVVIDDDKIDSTNLNRQHLYYNAVDRFKVDVLKEVLEKINGTKVKAIRDRFDKEKYSYIPPGDNVVLISCVDNFETRAELNRFAINYKMPLINASSNSEISKVRVYFPGKTACLNCQFPLYETAERHERLRKKNDQRESGTCTAHNHDPSVVYTNTFAGFAVVGEVFSYVNDSILKGSLSFNSLGSNGNKYVIGPNMSSKKGCGCNG